MSLFARTLFGVGVVGKGATIFQTPGNYSWVAPAGVTSVSVVAVGGGGSGEQDFRAASGGGGGGLRGGNTSFGAVVTGEWRGLGGNRGSNGVTSGVVVSGNCNHATDWEIDFGISWNNYVATVLEDVLATIIKL